MNFPGAIEVVASRKLQLISDAGENEVEICVGKPLPFPDGTGFYCPIWIRGLGEEKVQRIGGTDSLQALQLALNVLHARLMTLDPELLSSLRWNGGKHLGI